MQNLRKKIIDLFGSALIASTLSMSLSMILCSALFPVNAVGTVAWVTIALAFLCALSLVNRPMFAVSATIGVITLCWLIGSKSKPLNQLWELIGLITMGGDGESTLAEHASTIAVLLAAMLTFVLFWMTRISGGVYPALTLSILLVMVSWFLQNYIPPVYATMAVFALASMFARASDEKVSYMRAVPTAIIVALLAVSMLPGGSPTWKPLSDLAERARNLFDDYFLFTDPRTTYSISADGFQPMGEYLGGPAQPHMGNIMLVETDTKLLLRGSIKRTYTTYSWIETAVNSRYVFIDPSRRNVRNEIFDADRQPGFVRSGAFKQVKGDITMLAEGISALYVPHGLTKLSIPLDPATYFSSSGEVFITRGVVAGDNYAIEAVSPETETANMRELTIQRAGQGDQRYQEALSGYTALPQGIDAGVYAMVERAVRDAGTPYDRAMAIQGHLLSGEYTYNLDVEYPRVGRDFVSHFLLDTKQGYCSYFATAMAVMSRIAGMPSRYIEGYSVPVRPGGATIVTGKNAHAWVEIYFDGVGWVTFDPTPGSGDSYMPMPGGEGTGQENHVPPETDNQLNDPDPSDPDQHDPDGEDDAADADEHDAEPEGGEDQPDEPDDEEHDVDPDDSEQDPEDNPEDNSEDQSEDDTHDNNRNDPDRRNWLWVLILIPIAALALFIVKRVRDTDPRRATSERIKTEEKLMTWYRALLLALEQQGQSPAPGETPEQFAQRLHQANLAPDAFVVLSHQVTLNRYAAQRPQPAALRQARIAYDHIVGQLSPAEKVRWLAIRIRKGLGDTKQIP